ncbi:unnamed protein product [Pedinophyceae sp. YPF-701]|nr:unnamed protein product [Pedinophyceae sp. YPF-701]
MSTRRAGSDLVRLQRRLCESADLGHVACGGRLPWRPARRGFSSAAGQGAGAVSHATAPPLQATEAGAKPGLLQVYMKLSKFRLSMLVVSTACAGYALGSPKHIDWAGMAWTAAGTSAAAFSANAWNQVIEVANDSLMKRTRGRPLPSAAISRAHAAAFATITGATGLAVLATQCSELAAVLGAANIGLYTLVYTPLKVRSPVNTWVGAVVGAIPPLMGWAAATGSLSAGAFPLAAALYFWQMPHFMALAWMCKEDYRAGGYRMLSLLDATGRRTAACALRNSFYMLPLGVATVALGVADDWFAPFAVAAAAPMTVAAAAFWRKPEFQAARGLFRHSLYLLPAWMAALVAARVHVQDQQVRPWLADTVHRVSGASLVQRMRVAGIFPDMSCPSAVYCESEGRLRRSSRADGR